MLTLLIQIVVGTWLIGMCLGALVLIGLATALASCFVHEWQSRRRLLAQARSRWAPIADPWHGFTTQQLPAASLSPASRFTLPAGRPHHQTPVPGKTGGGLNIEMDSPDRPAA